MYRNTSVEKVDNMAGQEAVLRGTSVTFDPIYNRKIVTGNKKKRDRRKETSL